MTLADKFVVALAIGLLAGLYLLFWQPTAPASYARLIDHQHQVTSHSLHRDQKFGVVGKLGTSELQIKDGKIRFLTSPCTTKVCIHSGWLSHSGEVLACLPNGILVELIGADKRFDAINF